VIGGLAAVAGFQDAAPFLSLIVALFVGLEGPALRIAALERRGFRQRAFVEAESRADAELRYLMQRGPDSPGPAPVPERPRAAAPAEGRMLGLIDYPGAR
jgi:hypothetical protein